MTTFHYHIDVLKEHFAEKKRRNHRYSLRAYADNLGLHPSALSRILAGKQLLSAKSGLRIVKKLSMSKEERRLFLQSLLDEKKKQARLQLGSSVGTKDLGPEPLCLSEEVHAKVGSLPYITILELTQTDGFQSDLEWIAEKIGLSLSETQNAIDTLLEVGLLDKEDGVLKKVNRHLTLVNQEKTHESRRKLQTEILMKALTSLQKDSFESRGHYAMTMAVDPKKIPLANEMIFDFVEELCDFLETGERSQVYQLAVQLFPVSKKSNEQHQSEVVLEK